MLATIIQQPRASLVVRWMVVFCLILVSVAASAQAAHYHLDQSDGASKHCSLCLVLHSAASLTGAVQVSSSCQATGYMVVLADSADTAFPVPFRLFSRPPPLA
jgi:hypothetical protein